MKILVIDDNKKDRLLLRELLFTRNYEVSEAANGIEALVSVEASKPDIIISDVMMPEMDGFTLLHELKKSAFGMDIPFVFYTAHYLSEKDSELALKLGASRFIVKPADLNVLLEEIEAVLMDYKAGLIKPVKSLIEKEEDYLKLHSERIIKKLEEKIIQLEQEIKERRWAFEELAKTLNEFENVVENIPFIIYALNIDGNLIRWNSRLTETMGIMGNKVMGRPILDFIAEGDREKMAESIKTARELGYSSEDAHLIGKNGELITYRWNIAALKDENSKIIGLSGVGIELTG